MILGNLDYSEFGSGYKGISLMGYSGSLRVTPRLFWMNLVYSDSEIILGNCGITLACSRIAVSSVVI